MTRPHHHRHAGRQLPTLCLDMCMCNTHPRVQWIMVGYDTSIYDTSIVSCGHEFRAGKNERRAARLRGRARDAQNKAFSI